MRYEYQVPDEKRVRVIIDSDTACEADDPFAIAHALMSPKLIIRAVVAEHFAAPGSMHLSHEAIKRLTDAMGVTPTILLAAASFLLARVLSLRYDEAQKRKRAEERKRAGEKE